MSLLRRLLRGSSGLPEPPPFVREPFGAAGELELALERGDGAEVRRLLPAARVFVPSRAEESSLLQGADFRPIVLDYDGGPCVAVLTSSDRLRALLPAVPDVQSGLDVEASWVIANCPAGVGLAINPGWREGLVIPPGEIASLRS